MKWSESLSEFIHLCLPLFNAAAPSRCGDKKQNLQLLWLPTFTLLETWESPMPKYSKTTPTLVHPAWLILCWLHKFELNYGHPKFCIMQLTISLLVYFPKFICYKIYYENSYNPMTLEYIKKKKKNIWPLKPNFLAHNQ